MSQLALYLLGTPRLELDGVPITIDRRKVLALLAYLALTQHAHRRDHLAALFWSGYDQTSARANLRRALSLLNKSLDDNWLQTDREQIALKRGDDFWLDVDEFHQLLTDCTSHGHSSSEVCSDCLDPLNQAAALYQDDLLTGFTLPDSPEFDDWQLFQTESLRRELAEALEKLVRDHSAAKEFESATTYARRWLALDPLEEVAHRHLMRLLTLNGKRNAALAQYDTCRQILSGELGVEPTAETTALYQQIREGKLVTEDLTSAPSLPSPPAPRHNLPAQPTPFIGRTEELTEIARLIHNEPTCHLLTLVGPGGIGKTRLALQAATASIDTYSHGVYFVPLAPISAVESLIPTIAGALNFPLSGGEPKEQLLNYLRKKEMLLVLDNFEHLIPEGTTDLVSEIAATAPQVKLLVTSRERLNLQEEWSVEVQGMRISPRDEVETKSLETYSAIQLFLQRARRIRPDFTLSLENSPEIIRICHLVDGMPLGLELAAAWLRMMPAQEVRQEIQRNLDFLTTSVRNVPERHQSLRAVFEHSWRLLSEEEKAVFRSLSVFRGGFRRRAAERVAGASLPLLSALVDKSLLRRTRAGRYQIHELLRQYAAKKLSEVPDENEQVQNWHSEYYLTFLQQRSNDVKGRRQKNALDEVATDIDNIRAAWYRAIAQRNTTALGKSAGGLLLFSDYRGWFVEAEAAFRQAVEQLTEAQASKIVLAQLLAGQGMISVRLGFMVQGQELLQQSVSLLRRAESDPQRELAFSLFWLAHAYLFQGQYVEAKRDIQESLIIYTEAGDRWGIGVASALLGHTMTFQGAYVAANQLIRQSLKVFKQLGERRWMTYNIDFLGRIAQVFGEYEQAEKFLEESLQMRRELDTPFGIGYSMRELGYLAIALGNYQQAKKRMQESLTIYKEIGTRSHLIFPLDGLGSIARLRGEYQLAEQLHQESLMIAKDTGEGRGIAVGYGSLGRLTYDLKDCSRAEQLFQESLIRYKQLGHRLGIASTHCYLGYVACALGSDKHQEAKEQFYQALTIATEIGARPVVLNVLVGLATLLSTSESGDTEQEHGIELLALALHHPASEQETKNQAKRLLDKLASSLPPESVAAAQKRGQAQDLEVTAKELLAEFEK